MRLIASHLIHLSREESVSRVRHCTNPKCLNYSHPPRGWYIHFGSYHTKAHGRVNRVQCRSCGRTMSLQTFSIHYFAKRRLPLKEVFIRVRGGSSLRDIARELHVSRTAVQTAVLRLGRQSMAAQSIILDSWNAGERIVMDGLQSKVVSKDFPCHLTTVVDARTELIMTMTHTVVRRGGKLPPIQRRRRVERERVWKPSKGALVNDISLLCKEITGLCNPPDPRRPLRVDTDELPAYRSAIRRDMAMAWFSAYGLLYHVRTAGSLPRTGTNPLFPVNYVDMLLRHRMKEHTHRTIAFGRHSVHQMHRAWIMAIDHNLRQPRRIRNGDRSTTRAELSGVPERTIKRILLSFFADRLELPGPRIPLSIRRVWCGDLVSPPIRWRSGQREARKVFVPNFAMRDLEDSNRVGDTTGGWYNAGYGFRRNPQKPPSIGDQDPASRERGRRIRERAARSRTRF